MKQNDKSRVHQRANPNKETERIGIEIAKRRRVLGLTQEKLADKSGMSRQSICNIEQGKQAPTLTAMIRISSVLESSLDDLCIGKSNDDFHKESVIWLNTLERDIKDFSEERQEYLKGIIAILVKGMK